MTGSVLKESEERPVRAPYDPPPPLKREAEATWQKLFQASPTSPIKVEEGGEEGP